MPGLLPIKKSQNQGCLSLQIKIESKGKKGVEIICCAMTQNSPTTLSLFLKENSQNFYFQGQIYWIHHRWIMAHHLADLN